MLKQNTILILMLILSFVCFEAVAQDVPPGKWWKDPQVVKALELTSGQINQLEKAFSDSRRRLITQKNKVETEQFELQNLFDQKSMDEKAIKSQHMKVERAREELSTERLEYIMEVRRIIGYEKYNQLVHGVNMNKNPPKR